MIFLKILLLPLTIIYAGITTCRNKFYDLKLFKSVQVPIAVICVGNLKAGGTGKTPFTQYLVDAFSSNYKTAILSRGYGRKTNGFVLATKQSTSKEIGDEPLQLFNHSNNAYHVAVCEDRVAGVMQLRALFPDLQLVILDDGFQHRKIKRDVNVLLTEYKDPFFNDWVLPMGRLRECKIAAARADVVVVTKTPNIYKPLSHQGFISYIKPRVPVHYTGIRYGAYLPALTGIPPTKVILVTGLANPKPIVEYLNGEKIEIVSHFNFKDHYSYSFKDIQTIQKLQQNKGNIPVITTEKDWVKIVPLLHSMKEQHNWMYIPIQLDVFSNESALMDLIQQKIDKRLYSLSI